ncbi:MAG TPA: LCP family protein [Lacisediminihabitans sp.]|uniref:LCP family protein n=1 Tax=Lacisediminihabitans sp. TaxID=2787631 RepID=UPI002ED7AF7A
MSELRPRRRRGPLPVARHGRLKRSRPVRTVFGYLGGALAVVLVSVLSVTAVSAYQLVGDVGSGVHLLNETDGPAPAIGDYSGGFNVLIAGSDDGSGEAQYGKRGENLNDVTILLHVSADHSNAVAVSFPRDLMVPIPACPKADGSGTSPASSSAQINETLERGGLACTVLTVEALTGLTIPYAGEIHFAGVVEMSNAIGGVPVCVTAPIHDPYTGLSLPAGTSTISGAQALAFLRSRHGVGDGSDLGRINSQQVFLSSMIRTIRSADVLGNPLKVYSLAKAAATNMQLSSSLENVTTIVSMAEALKSIPPKNITFVQYPSATGLPGIAPGRVGPLTAEATALMDQIKADKPFSVDASVKKIGSELDPTATTSPSPSTSATATPSPSDGAAPVLSGVGGQTADQQTCSIANR